MKFKNFLCVKEYSVFYSGKMYLLEYDDDIWSHHLYVDRMAGHYYISEEALKKYFISETASKIKQLL